MSHYVKSAVEPCGNFGSCALPAGHTGPCAELSHLWTRLELAETEQADGETGPSDDDKFKVGSARWLIVFAFVFSVGSEIGEALALHAWPILRAGL